MFGFIYFWQIVSCEWEQAGAGPRAAERGTDRHWSRQVLLPHGTGDQTAAQHSAA